MAFEIFKETGTRRKEFISVTDTKSFGLSRAFLDKFDITSDHKAVIFFDADTNKIALHFSLNNPKFGFSVRISNPKHGATIIARSFFDLKSIDPKKYSGRYDDFDVVSLIQIGQNTPGKAYVITLKERIIKPDHEPIGTVDDVIIEDINDEPINLDDIPF